MGTSTEITLRPIGYVKSKARSEGVDKKRISEIVIDGTISPALEGVDAFSHIFVLYWMHQVPVKEKRKLKVSLGRGLTPRGAFASRTEKRPNPIGLTLVQLREIRENVVRVKGLDAVDGTPVLDIKPFESADFAKRATSPEWWPEIEL